MRAPDFAAAMARNIGRNCLQIVYNARLGHPGGDLSATDILAALYSTVLHVDPKNTHMRDRDRFILGKGHCSAAPATLVEAGFIPDQMPQEYMQPLSLSNGHPGATRSPEWKPTPVPWDMVCRSLPVQPRRRE